MQILRMKKWRKGNSLVEFGLSATLVLTLLFGILDWAWVFFQYQTIVWRTSDAARWAAANRVDVDDVDDDVDNVGSIQNMVLCGTTAPCLGGGGMGFYVASDVTVRHFSTQDQVDTSRTVGSLKRWFVEVKVTVQTNSQSHHFIPGFSSMYPGKTITVVQPMECQADDGNCQNWK